VLPSHPPVPHGAAAAPDNIRGRTRALVLVGLVLAVLAVVTDGTAGLALVLTTSALSAAGLLALRADRVAETPARTTADVDPLTPTDVTECLRRLYDDHVEQINMALAEDRDDLVQELSDSYMDQSLRLITAGERPSSDSLALG